MAFLKPSGSSTTVSDPSIQLRTPTLTPSDPAPLASSLSVSPQPTPAVTVVDVNNGGGAASAIMAQQIVQMASIQATTQAQASIRADLSSLATKLSSDVSDHVDLNEKNATLARAELDKRIALLELNIQNIKTTLSKK